MTRRGGRLSRVWQAIWLVVLPLCTAAPASAQFTNNNYTLDLYQGPAFGSGRIVGLGGAYTAIATGLDGSALNPAAYSERGEHEVGWFDWEVTGGLWLSGLFVDNDFDNNGNRALADTDAKQIELGLRLQFGAVGIGAVGRARLYELRRTSGSMARTSSVSLYTTRFGAAYARDDFVVGASVIFAGLDVDTLQADVLTSADALGVHLGGLYRPKGERYRIGAAFRSRIRQCLAACSKAALVPGEPLSREGLVLPADVIIPWELRTGFAYQWGERRTNVGWKDTQPLRRRLQQEIRNGTYEPPPTLWGKPYKALPTDNPRRALRRAMRNHREFRRRWRHQQPRRYVLLSVDAALVDRTPNGQGLEAFLTQTPQASGKHYSFALHGGMETEVVADILKLRGGLYVEPSRFAESRYRPHFTMGGDVRLFDFWRWSSYGRVTIDVASRYLNWGLSWGIWR